MALEKFASLLQHRSTWLVLTFSAFVTVQFAFAAIYLWLYKRKRDNFYFNSDILNHQLDATQDLLGRELARTGKAIETLHELKAELDRGVIPQVEPWSHAGVHLPSGRKCVMVFLTGPPHGGAHGCRLEIIDENGSLLFGSDATKTGVRGWVDNLRWLETRDEWQKAVPYLLRRLEARHQEQTRRLASIATGAPDVWSYWDFLYFSTILQTTVGLGDILPNSTPVRMIVTAQIGLGYALVVFVLNLVVSH